MKRSLLRLTALSAAAVMLCGCSSEETKEGFKAPYVDEYSADVMEDLPDPEKNTVETIYDEIVKGLSETENEIKFSGSVEFDDVDKAVNRIIFEHPEFFWISGYDVSTNRRSTTVKMWVLDNADKVTLTGMRNILSSEADRIIAQIPAGSSDLDKVIFVHDYIVEHTDYDKSIVHSDQTGHSSTAYGCLIQGKAICQGYSLAFMYIMNKLGIECGVTSGNTDTTSHAWNYVTINGATYWVDTTWDDPSFVGESTGSLSHAYCLINDEMLLRTRTIRRDDGRYVPVCSFLNDNYFVRKGAYFTSYDREQLRSVLSASASSRNVELMFQSRQLLDSAVTELITNCDLWELADRLSSSDPVSYYVDEEMYILKLIF